MKKTVAPGAKTPLFDRVFKPELITLENGHTVTRPRSRTPLLLSRSVEYHRLILLFTRM